MNVKFVSHFIGCEYPVYLVINGEHHSLNRYVPYSIKLKPGIHTYNYEVNGKLVYSNYKLTIINNNKTVSNYIEIDTINYNEEFEKRSIEIGDIDVLFSHSEKYPPYSEEYYKFTKMAADGGHHNAALEMAYHYEYLKNYSEMERYLLISIDGRNIRACCEYADFCIKNYDYENAEKYLQHSISLNKSIGYFKLGKFYQYITKDYAKMKQCYEKSINKGNKNAMYHYGKYYQYIERDYNKMIEYYYKTKLSGQFKYLVNIRMALYCGSISKNYKQMMKLLFACIENKEYENYARFVLGLYFRYISPNYKLMLAYWKPAKKYNIIAYELGKYYYEIEDNTDKMKKYLILSAKSGNSDAAEQLVKYYKYIEPNTENEAIYKLLCIEDNLIVNEYEPIEFDEEETIEYV